jgi:hypothetical protein
MEHFWAIWIPVLVLLYAYGFIEIKYTNKNYRWFCAFIWIFVVAIALGICMWNG